MPSPLGHALAGFAAGWLVAGPPTVTLPGRRALTRALGFAALGMAADADLLIGRHSGFTHSIGMSLAVGLAAYGFLRLSARRGSGVQVRGVRLQPDSGGDARSLLVLAFAAAAAYGTHVLLDWLAADATPPWGITALWPFTSAYYLSRLDLFWGISREPWRPGAAWHDVLAVSREILLLGPAAWGAWRLHRRSSRHILPDAPGNTRQQLPPGRAVKARSESL